MDSQRSVSTGLKTEPLSRHQWLCDQLTNSHWLCEQRPLRLCHWNEALSTAHDNTLQCHTMIQHNVTPWHTTMSHHDTQQCHTMIHCNVTPWHTMTYYNVTPWHTTMSHHDTPWYTAMSHHDTPWYSTMSHHDILQCHTMTYYNVTPWHTTMSHHDTLQCHTTNNQQILTHLLFTTCLIKIQLRIRNSAQSETATMSITVVSMVTVYIIS